MAPVKYEPAELLQMMRVPRHDGVYVLGSLERRVTLYSQQVRAINLAYSLHAVGELTPETTVAVVGAGAAALTFASAILEWTPASVVLLEREDQLMPIQRTCTNRWLHPHVYDWPAVGSLVPDANLPFLTWSEDTAANVVGQIETGWKQIEANRSDRVQVEFGAADTRLALRAPHGGVLSWSGGKGFVAREFDIVVLAVGYGVEASAPPSRTSYWAGDDLEFAASKRQRWLVSGCGDGGLADVLRLSLNDAAKTATLAWLVGDVMMEPRCQKLLEIEKLRDRAKVNAVYSEVCEPVVAKMHNRLRSTEVTLNGETTYPFGGRGSILNRFLVAQLNQLQKVRYRLGRFTPAINADGTVAVTFDDGKTETYDRVVMRHGPVPALAADFRAIWDQFEAQRKSWEEIPYVLDRSRIPMWTEPDRVTRVESVHRSLSELRPVGAPIGAGSQPVNQVTAETICAEVFATALIPVNGQPIHLELEIAALNTTRKNLQLNKPYILALRRAEDIRASDVYGALRTEHDGKAVLVSFDDRPDIPAGGSYRWRMSLHTPGVFRRERGVLSGVYIVRPQHEFQDVTVKLHTFWYDFVFQKPQVRFGWLREYRVIQSNNRGLRCDVSKHRDTTRCSFKQFQLGPDEELRLNFTCLYQLREGHLAAE